VAESLRSDTASPELPAEPIPDAATTVLPPGNDISNDLPVGVRRLGKDIVVTEDSVLPMSDEVRLRLGIAVRAPVGFRLLLLVEEDVDVGALDCAEVDVDDRSRPISAITLSLAGDANARATRHLAWAAGDEFSSAVPLTGQLRS
jgi:hypothetical protein